VQFSTFQNNLRFFLKFNQYTHIMEKKDSKKEMPFKEKLTVIKPKEEFVAITSKKWVPWNTAEYTFPSATESEEIRRACQRQALQDIDGII
jgi:hypothetical protein